MPMPKGREAELMREAIASEAVAQRALLDGDAAAARRAFGEAARLYRSSWEHATPTSYGRLIGMLKAAVLAGDATDATGYARTQIPDPGESAPAHYALAIAALAAGEDAAAGALAAGMRGGSPAFVRTADAIAALATGDGAAYAAALRAIVADFEARDEHLTGVAIADTAVMLERLAAARGLAAGPASELLPTAPASS